MMIILNKFRLITFLVFSIIICGCTSVSNKASNQQADKGKPNIIYILADDLGYGDLGCYGQKVIKTPNIDHLAKEGMLFTDHYAGSTVCAPSRAVLLTGLHTGHTFIRSNGKNLQLRKDPEDLTIGKYLQDAGYTAAMIGKASTGCDNTVGHINDKGFDYFFGYMGHAQAHAYFPNFLHRNSEQINFPNNGGTKTWRGEVYSADLILDEALGFIQDKKEEPFFMMYASALPHAQMWVPEEFKKDYMGKFEEKPHGYTKVPGPGYGICDDPNATTAGMISRLDWEIGKILKELEKQGISENTVVMFSSDNGPHKEGGRQPEAFNSSGPLRGIKRDLYEGGIRVPFIVKWPGVVQPNSKSDYVSAFWDILPTLTEIAGVESPKDIDGISLVPTLKGKRELQKEHEYMYWEFRFRDGLRALRKGDWKLLEFTNIKSKEKRYELYNLKEDIGEKHNQVGAHPNIAEELKILMKSARSEAFHGRNNF